MSRALPRRTDHDDATDAELARWPGVTWTRTLRGKHYALVLTFGGLSRFVTYSCTPSDGGHGLQNHLRDVRKVCAEIGARRTPEPKTKSPQRQRNRTQPRLVANNDKATGGPLRDPWAALSAIRVDEPPKTLNPPPAPPLGFWRRMLHKLTAWARKVTPKPLSKYRKSV